MAIPRAAVANSHANGVGHDHRRDGPGNSDHDHHHVHDHLADHHHVHGGDHDHAHDYPGHTHDHAGYHTHGIGGHSHSHLPPGTDGGPVTWRNLLALGVAGGLLPCPSALVLMLGAIAVGQVAFGLALVATFSAGLALVLTGIGVAFVYARRLLATRSGGPMRRLAWVARFAPVGSALLISLLGLGMTVGALAQTGLL